MNDNETTAARELGEKYLGLTARRIGQLADEGILIKDANGEYPVQESVRNYCAYLKKSAKESKELMRERKIGEELKNDERRFDKQVREGDWGHRNNYRDVFIDFIRPLKSFVDELVETAIDQSSMSPSEIEKLEAKKTDTYNRIADQARSLGIDRSDGNGIPDTPD